MAKKKEMCIRCKVVALTNKNKVEYIKNGVVIGVYCKKCALLATLISIERSVDELTDSLKFIESLVNELF